MRESLIEKFFVDQAKQHGGLVRKVVYQGRAGSPDRWAFFPGGQLLIVELKAPTKKPAPHQVREMERLRAFGFFVAWLDTKEKVDQVLADRFNLPLEKFNELWPIS